MFFVQDYTEQTQDTRITTLKERKHTLLKKRRIKEHSNLSMIIFLNLKVYCYILHSPSRALEIKIVPKGLQWKVAPFPPPVSSGVFEAGSYQRTEDNFVSLLLNHCSLEITSQIQSNSTNRVFILLSRELCYQPTTTPVPVLQFPS